MSNHLSRYLARLLRHEARSSGLEMSPEGYVNVEEILELSDLSQYDEDDVRKVVRRDQKGRFTLRTSHGKLQIRATQGHSLSLSAPELTLINHYTEARCVIHGTRRHNLQTILETGVSRMNRDHIHFAPGETGVKSGMPGYCDTVIEINLEKAMKDGIRFYKSENGVILSEGNAEGYIPKKYFKRIYDRRTKADIPFVL